LEPYSLDEVLDSLADQLPDDLVDVETVTIEQANPRHYMVRVYVRGADDFEAFQIRDDS
jgi:hypothetical protein